MTAGKAKSSDKEVQMKGKGEQNEQAEVAKKWEETSPQKTEKLAIRRVASDAAGEKKLSLINIAYHVFISGPYLPSYTVQRNYFVNASF